jgi:nucleoside-diphosphate-sugar epimerase
MRILLVGGTGLIGSAIRARLSAEGHEYLLVSRHRRRCLISITSRWHGRPRLRDGRAFLQVSMPLSMRRAPCRGRTCKAFMSPDVPSEIFDDDSYVVHPLERHVFNLQGRSNLQGVA